MKWPVLPGNFNPTYRGLGIDRKCFQLASASTSWRFLGHTMTQITLGGDYQSMKGQIKVKVTGGLLKTLGQKEIGRF